MANHDDSTIHYIYACKYTINFLYVCILCVAVNVDVRPVMMTVMVKMMIKAALALKKPVEVSCSYDPAITHLYVFYTNTFCP